MKKLLFGLGTAMLLLSAELPAQAIFQLYYQWSNAINADHGPYNKVKTWMNGNTPMYFAVGGATNPANNVRVGTLSLINGNSTAMIFTKTITSPFHMTGNFEAVSVAVANISPSPIIAVLCNHDNGAGVSQAILYEFDVNGNVLAALNLGAGKAVDVVYNPSAFAFDVLCEVNGAVGTDFELTGVDLFGFTIVWNQTYNWGEKDKPSAIIIDNGEIVAGGYTEIGNDRQILMIRTAFDGTLIWGQPFGLPNRKETITDIVFYFNLDNQFRYGFCGWDDLTGQALVGDVAISGPQFGYTERYITSVNGQQFRTSHANAIARSDNNIFICGTYDDNSPFIASFLKNANITPQNFRFYDDGEDVPEELRDITCELGASARVASVGYQQRSVAWGASPANQNYSWIMTTSTLGVSNCRTSANEVTALFNSSNPFQLVSVGAGSNVGPFTGFANNSLHDELDNCITPARLAAEEGAIEEAKVAARFSSLYPNPGNGTFYLDGAVAENENVLITVTDLQGRIVATKQLIAGVTQQAIELNDLANGVYSWSVLVNGEIMRSDKLIIAR
jgi:hypothetical protein